MPTAGGTLPPPSHVTNAKRAISYPFQDSRHHAPDTGFGVVARSTQVAPEQLPRVHVAGSDEAVEHQLAFSSRLQDQLGPKLTPHRTAVPPPTPCPPPPPPRQP